jgi:hypothetical protein
MATRSIFRQFHDGVATNRKSKITFSKKQKAYARKNHIKLPKIYKGYIAIKQK